MRTLACSHRRSAATRPSRCPDGPTADALADDQSAQRLAGRGRRRHLMLDEVPVQIGASPQADVLPHRHRQTSRAASPKRRWIPGAFPTLQECQSFVRGPQTEDVSHRTNLVDPTLKLTPPPCLPRPCLGSSWCLPHQQHQNSVWPGLRCPPEV